MISASRLKIVKLHILLQTLRSRMIFLAIIMVCLPTVLIGYIVEIQGRDAILSEKQIKLYGIAQLLDQTLKNGLSDFSALPREQRIQALNRQLSSATDDIAHAFPGVGAGYYSRELDAIITYAPQNLHGKRIGITISADHPGRKVMSSGEALVESGNQVRGHIMNAMIPIKRDGKIIGYIWANELSNDIEQQALAMDMGILLIITLGLLCSLGIIIPLSRRFSHDVDVIKSGLSSLSFNLQTQLPSLKGEMGEITDSVNALAHALREAKTLNELIIESAVDGVITVDITGCVTMLNPAAEKITGYKRGELINKPYQAVFGNRDFESPLLDTLRFGVDHVGIEVDYPARNGIIQISSSTSHLRNANGEIIGALVIFTDLTAKKAMQRQIERAERLASLGELMAGVAHEIRNPLTTISGFVQYLQGGESDPKRQEYIKIVLQEVHSINKVIQQLLDIARPQPGNYTQVSLNELIKQSLVLIKTRGIDVRIDFKLRLADNLPCIEADGELLKQVLLNLLINAVQAIHARGEIIIITRTESATKQVIQILDTGCGIKEPIKNKIFTPFYTTKPSGTGLGLSIVQRIITAHHGDIALENRAVQGTIATIILPIRQKQDNQ